MRGNLTARLRREFKPWQRKDLDESYALYNEVRARQDLNPTKRLSSTLSKPTSNEGNAKLNKTALFRDACVGGRALAQGNTSGLEVCPWRTKACSLGCLGAEGNYIYPRNTRVKVARTHFEYEFPHHAWSIYEAEIAKDLAYASKRGWDLFWRPDILSDSMIWSVLPELFDSFPTVGFYGYTKNWRSVMDYPQGWVLPNYRLALSASERKEPIAEALRLGVNVAMVFDVASSKDLPTSYLGYPVVNGSDDDTWMLSETGVIGGLVPIGYKMRNDTSGFVREVPPGARNAKPSNVDRTVLIAASRGA